MAPRRPISAVAKAAATPSNKRSTPLPAPLDADAAGLPPHSHCGGDRCAPPPAALLAKAERIRAQLTDLYPPPVPVPLDHGSPFQLLCAVVLSAQSTDALVNKASPVLFARAPDPRAMAALGAEGGILPLIKSVGLAPTKARNLAALSAILLERHGGEVPRTLAGLVALPGVGRKTASVVLSQAFGGRAFPVDTHIHRLAQRWGLTPPGPKVEQTEADLRAVFPRPGDWRDLHLRIIFFGREHCPARGHDPRRCPVCSWAAVPPFDGASGAAAPGASPVKAGGGKAAAAVAAAAAAGGPGASPVKAGGGKAAAAEMTAVEAADARAKRPRANKRSAAAAAAAAPGYEEEDEEGAAGSPLSNARRRRPRRSGNISGQVTRLEP